MTTLNGFVQNAKGWKKKTAFYKTELKEEIDIKFY